MSPGDTLHLLCATVDLSWGAATMVLDQEDMIYCEVRRQRRDGRWSCHHVEVREGKGTRLIVRESEPRRLPIFCPERHINPDGSFCLGWEPGGPRLPSSPDQAREWWAQLRGYLRLQDAAATSRAWREDCAWPHGEAARYEWARETLLSTLPSAIETEMRAGSLLRTRRAYCPCGSGRRLKDCHEKDVETILQLTAARDRAEADYWRSVLGHRCCGTMDGCKLDRVRGKASERVL